MEKNPLKSLNNNYSKADQIEMRLREYFKLEGLQPGDPIPYESELAQTMGVSRTALREGIARLKSLGLIESKRNRGMILTQPDILRSMERVLEPSFLDSNTLRDIFELRLVLELGISELLFLRKSSAQLMKLESIIEREESTDDRFVKNRCDVEFHATLYEMSGNKTILRFQKILLPIFNYVYNSITVEVSSRLKSEISHRDLLGILENGDATLFREKMKAHLKSYFEIID